MSKTIYKAIIYDDGGYYLIASSNVKKEVEDAVTNHKKRFPKSSNGIKLLDSREANYLLDPYSLENKKVYEDYLKQSKHIIPKMKYSNKDKLNYYASRINNNSLTSRQRKFAERKLKVLQNSK